MPLRGGSAAPAPARRYVQAMSTADGQPAAPEGERHPERYPAGRFEVIVNAGAGGAGADDVAERVRAALAEAGIAAVVRVASGTSCRDAAALAAADPSCAAVVAVGGDGTVSAVAGAVAGTGKPLGILPLGTLNHFAKDLGLPLELADAARALATALPRTVDVAEVNGRVFVNNSSIGVYPRAVRTRKRLRARLGKWLAMGLALVRVIVRIRPLSVRIRWEGGARPRRTTFVFVGNNVYDTELLATQRRAALDAGVLGVYAGAERSRLGLLRLALRALRGRIDPARDLEALVVPWVTLESHRRTLLVSVDGEVVRLAPPIRYRIRPGALRVLAPPPR